MTPSVRNFFAPILMAAGALIAGAGGLCTMSFIVNDITLQLRNHATVSPSLDFLIICLIIGAVPMVLGAGLFVAGNDLRKSSAPEEDASSLPPSSES